MIKRILIVFLFSILHMLVLLTYAKNSTVSKNEGEVQINPILTIADQFYHHSEYDSAITYYSAAAKLFEQNNENSEFLNCLINLSKSNIEIGQYDTAYYFAKRAESLLIANTLHNVEKSAETDYLLGYIHGKLGESGLAEDLYYRAFDKCKQIQYDSLQAVLGKAIGNINFSKGNYDEALENYRNALDMESSRLNPSDQLRASLIQNVGIIYSLLGKYELASDYFERSMVLKEKLLEKDDPHLANVYINFGRFQTVLGNLQEALYYLDKAEELFYSNFGSDYPGLAAIFFNKGSIYLIRSDYDKALDYHEKAIELYNKIRKPDDYIFGSLYMNIGIIYENYKQFDKAIEYYSKGFDFDLQPDTYIRALGNLASCYYLMDDYSNSEKNYLFAISEAERYFGQNNFLTSNMYLNYGIFCNEIGKPDEAYKYIQKSYSINSKIKGLSENFLANNLAQLGTHHLKQKNYPIALEYFQLALISIVQTFHEGDKYENPEYQELYVDLNLFNALYSKAQTFYGYYSNESHEIKDLLAAYETAILSVKLNDMIKSSFGAENTKLIFTSRTNDLYNLAVIAAVELYELTGEQEYYNKSFELSEKSKGAVLLSSIRELEAINIGNIPEEIRNEENALNNAITSYEKLILDEIQKETPDSSKLVIWKNAVFARSLKYDSLVVTIEKNYPDYYNLKYSNETVKIKDIQDYLSNEDLLIEYKVADSVLITYCLSRDTVYLIKSIIKDGFSDKVENYVSFINSFPLVSNISTVFNAFTNTSTELYNILINPIFNINQFSKLIIVPDDYLGYMTFEALIQEEYQGEKANYRGLNYLIKDFTISYSNSATILLNKVNNKRKPKALLAMAPNYKNNDSDLINTSINIRDLSQYLNPLEYTLDEVKNVNSIFKGKLLIEEDATERNFKNEASQYGILHFAMHTIINDENPLTSKLVFSLNNDTLEDGFLNTYEIYNLDLNAELAVLSACKTGFGKLSKGEGIMSLARGFLYAGVPGIVMTLWEVEDISSASIMTDFYKFLKKGYYKDEALRSAKLLYLESANQLNSHPYFWAAYVQIGDNSPVGQSSKPITLFVIIASIVFLGFGYYKIRKRKKSQKPS